jgi:hypothetical protein
MDKASEAILVDNKESCPAISDIGAMQGLSKSVKLARGLLTVSAPGELEVAPSS